MATKLKAIATTTDNRLLNADTLYIDSNRMSTIRTGIERDLDSIKKAFEDVSKKSKSAVSKQAVYDDEQKYIKKIAKSAANRAKYSQTRKVDFRNKLKSQTDLYKAQLLENRISELEAIVQKLLAASNK